MKSLLEHLERPQRREVNLLVACPEDIARGLHAVLALKRADFSGWPASGTGMGSVQPGATGHLLRSLAVVANCKLAQVLLRLFRS